MRKTNRFWTDEERARLIKAWNSGQLVDAIAADLNRPYDSINGQIQWLRNRGVRVSYRREQGVPSRGRAEYVKAGNPIVKFLFEEMDRQRATYREVGERAGVDRSTIQSWAYSKAPMFPNLEAVLGALGYQLEIREIDRTAQYRNELPNPLRFSEAA